MGNKIIGVERDDPSAAQAWDRNTKKFPAYGRVRNQRAFRGKPENSRAQVPIRILAQKGNIK